MKKTILATVLALGMATGTAMAQDHMNMTDHQGMQSGEGMMMQGQGNGTMMNGGGMGQGRMDGGMMYNMTADNQQKFMNDTKEMRQKMHTLRFEYMEAMRNPKTTLKDLGDMEQKMLDMRKDMLKKAEKYQGVQK